jgi:flagellar hook-length control protein FliK
MTTDRTAAPTRSTALADRPSSAGRPQAPSSDAFAVLLGASTQTTGDGAQVRRDTAAARRNDATDGREDVSKRRDDVSKRRDDTTRADHAHRADRRPDQQRDDAPRVTDKPQDEVPAAPEAPAAATDAATDAVPAETPAAPTMPSLFAMQQLASPLPSAATPEVKADAPAEPAALPAFAGQIPASVAAATTAQTAATAATAASVATAEPATPPPADTQATTGAIALTGLPAEATADTTVPAGLDLSKATATADTATTPAQDAAVPADASQQQTGGEASGQEQPDTPAQPTTTPAAAATAAAAAPKVDAPVEAAPVAAPATTAPVTAQAAPAQVTTPSVERAVPLSRAVASTGLLIQLAAERGVTHARLNLKPVELGGIEVRLQTSPQGVHAQLVADSPEAARMLSSASEDLRRSLEDRDVTLLSLDVSTSGDQARDQPAGFSDAFGEDYRPGGWSSHRVSTGEDGLMDSAAAAETTLVLPDGVHVDVLA